jgi:hypothetical protein
MSRQSPADLVNKFVKEAVNKSQDGPVPEVMLYRLLSVAEAVFRQELEIDDRRLAGLRLGYALEDKVAENAEAGAAEGAIPQKLYWVGWGHHSIYDELLEPEKPSSDDKAYPTIDTSSSALPEDVLKELINQLREEMIRSTPPTLLEGKIIRPFVFGHTINSIKVPGSGGPSFSFPIDGGDAGSGGGTVERLEVIFSGQGPCNCKTPGSSSYNGRGNPCLEGNCN